jgi:hypothetical protein
MRVNWWIQAFAVLIVSAASSVRARTQTAAINSGRDSAIFAALRDSLGKGHKVFLQSHTSGAEPLRGLGSPDSTRVEQRLANFQSSLNVPHALVRALVERNAERVPIDKTWFPRNSVRVIRESEVDRLEALGNAVFEISRPVVSADGAIALVYAGWSRGSFGAPHQFGYAQVYRLDRIGNEYHVTRTALAWMR